MRTKGELKSSQFCHHSTTQTAGCNLQTHTPYERRGYSGQKGILTSGKTALPGLTQEGEQLCPHLHLSEQADSGRCQSAKEKGLQVSPKGASCSAKQCSLVSVRQNLPRVCLPELRRGSGGGTSMYRNDYNKEDKKRQKEQDLTRCTEIHQERRTKREGSRTASSKSSAYPDIPPTLTWRVQVCSLSTSFYSSISCSSNLVSTLFFSLFRNFTHVRDFNSICLNAINV